MRPLAAEVRYFMDGDQVCAVRPDFVDLQESVAGFGRTKPDALADLVANEAKERSLRLLPAVEATS